MPLLLDHVDHGFQTHSPCCPLLAGYNNFPCDGAFVDASKADGAFVDASMPDGAALGTGEAQIGSEAGAQPLPGSETSADACPPCAQGRCLHSFTSELNLSAFHGIGGARRDCAARVKGVLRGV
jgi:hypothetical protein